MNLAGAKKPPAKAKKEKAVKKSAAPKKDKASKTATKRAFPKEEIEEQDTPIVADTEPVVEEIPHEYIADVPAFVGGFVAQCLAEGVSPAWRKTAESDLLGMIIRDDLYVTQLFVGDIAAKGSFVQGKGGAALL